MKKKMIIKIVLLIAILLIIITQVKIYPFFIRPVKIKIIDKETKQPLENILVYYKMDTSMVNNILGLPIIEPIFYPVRKKMIFKTDSNGGVYLKRYIIFNKLWEFVSGDTFYINIDIREEFEKKDFNKIDNFLNFFEINDIQNSEKFYNVNDHYKGFVLASSYRWQYSRDKEIESKRIYSVLWNSNGLKKGSEEFTIELEKW